jgi:shikimate dehydrogenase
MYGIIGKPLSHSFSPDYFNKKFETLGIDEKYLRFTLDNIEAFPTLVQQQPNLMGLNVTIPYKTAIIPYLHELDATAAAVNAVNTIHFFEGKLKGYNTDVIGFKNTLLPLLEFHHKKALILGTGGASKAVAFVLDQLGITWQYVSRTATSGYLQYDQVDAALLKTHLIIINTTPLGTWPNIATAPPLPYAAITADHILYDLVYNPPLTTFLAYGQQQQAIVKNGYDMLIGQAEASWNIWNA